MCSPVTCSLCGKPGWRGCGAHVEQILGHVPKDQRCKCTAEEKAAAPSGGIVGWLRSLF
jgi:hypothetical protein